MAGFADIEELLIGWAKTNLGYRYVTDERPLNLVELIRTDPAHVIERFGGADITPTVDVARVDWDVYANTRAAAKHHAEVVRAAVRTGLVGTVLGGVTVVGRVETLSAPQPAPYDSRNTVRRMTMAFQLTLHQFSGVS